jgi:lipid-A-disaccharide synthase
VAKPLRIFISAGEASGDAYGASLIEALQARVRGAEFFGCGGDRMRDAGCRTLVDARRIAMVGLVEVIPGLARAWDALGTLRKAIDREAPQLAILIDFPDFNLRLAKQLKRAGVPVLYFVAPQVWAWRRWRLGAIRRSVDRLLCLFPFEEKFFRAAGVRADFIGHPLALRARPRWAAAEFRQRHGLPPEGPLIALLPGSRRKEVLLNLPPMLEAARLLAAERQCSFVMPAASTIAGDWLRQQANSARAAVVVVENATYDAVAHSYAAIVASGTAATETALLGTPMVIVYRVSSLSWALGRRLLHTPFYSMVNLVAGRAVVPELIQEGFRPEAVAREIAQLLDVPTVRQRMQADLAEVAERLRPPLPERPALSSGFGLEPVEAQIHDPIQRAAGIAESMLKGALSEPRAPG